MARTSKSKSAIRQWKTGLEHQATTKSQSKLNSALNEAIALWTIVRGRIPAALQHICSSNELQRIIAEHLLHPLPASEVAEGLDDIGRTSMIEAWGGDLFAVLFEED
jgi:hypothetical protein